MTGSLLFNRQLSSTAGHSNVNKVGRPKLRRCSSVDDHNSFDLTVDENQPVEKLFSKHDSTTSDSDSGIEDFEQVPCQKHDVNEEEVEKKEETPCFDSYEDENSTETVVESVENIEQRHLLYRDLELAAHVPHEDKKNFCPNTSDVFHGEFSRLISCPISLNHPGLRYYLFVEEAFGSDPCDWPNFAYVKLDNAKAQFKCANPECGRLWTSMRARISFKISVPNAEGFVVLKIYGQTCQSCDTPSDALWYMEEVCRVMENLSRSIYETFFSSENFDKYLQNTGTVENSIQFSRRSRHDPQQRRGKMLAPHNKERCEACQRGWCFA